MHEHGLPGPEPGASGERELRGQVVHRHRRGLRVAQLPEDDLALDLQRDQQEEEHHQRVVDERVRAELEDVGTADLDLDHRFGYAWFLDPATRMNPHLRFAQLVRGNPRERGSGIIDSRWFIEVVDAVGLLQDSKAWSARDQQQLQEWFSAYLKWLLTSPNGEHERNAKNNHGSWYAAQTAAYALFIGDTATARGIIESVKQRIREIIQKEDPRHPLSDQHIAQTLARENTKGFVAPMLHGWPFVVTLAAGGFFLQSTLPVNVMFGQAIAPVSAATVSSLMMGFAWGTGGLSVPLVGLVADRIGIEPTLIGLAGVPLLAAACALPLPSSIRHVEPRGTIVS